MQNYIVGRAFGPEHYEGCAYTGIWCLFPVTATIPRNTGKTRIRLDGVSKGSGPFYGANWDRSCVREIVGWNNSHSVARVTSGRWNIVLSQDQKGIVVHRGVSAAHIGAYNKQYAHTNYCGVSGAFTWDLGTWVAYCEVQLQYLEDISLHELLTLGEHVLDANVSFLYDAYYSGGYSKMYALMDAVITGMFPNAWHRIIGNLDWWNKTSSHWDYPGRVTALDYRVDTIPEPTRYNEYYLADAANHGMVSNRYYSGFGSALQNAVENLPQSTTNLAANILETSELLVNVFKGVSNLPKTASDAWLAYRYMYSTTKADLEEYVALTQRLTNLLSDDNLVSWGLFVDGPYIFTCELILEAQSLIPHSFVDWLKKYGLELNLTNMWDMVPYSFVVDWFLGISDILQRLDRYNDCVPFKSKACWYSVSTLYEGVNTYARLQGGSFPVGYPRITFHGTSKRTLAKRFVDGVCLIGGA